MNQEYLIKVPRRLPSLSEGVLILALEWENGSVSMEHKALSRSKILKQVIPEISRT